MLAKRKSEFDFELYEEEILQEQPVTIEKPAPRLNRRLRVKCFVLVTLFAALAIFTTIRSEMIISQGYTLVKMQAQVGKVEAENERLRLDVAQMKSPQRIKNFAVSELGMIIPQNVYFASQSGN